MTPLRPRGIDWVVAKRRDAKRLELCGRIQKTFGERFREARKRTGRLQKTISVEMGLTRTTISNIERGTQRLYLDQIFQAAHVLGVEVPTLLPTVDEVYAVPSIRTATDAPLTKAVTEEAQRIIDGVLSSEGRTRKQDGKRRRRNTRIQR